MDVCSILSPEATLRRVRARGPEQAHEPRPMARRQLSKYTISAVL